MREPLTWHRFLRLAAWADLIVLGATAVVLTDLEAAAIAAAMGAGLFLLRTRASWAGVVLLGVMFANVTAWMAPGAVSNLTHRDDFAATAVPSVLAVVSVAGLLAAIVNLLRRRTATGAGEARFVAAATGVVLIAALVGGVVAQAGSGVAADEDAIVVDTKDVRFIPDRLDAEAGTLDVVVNNKDLFWHTLTIPELDVDIRVPVGATRSATFEAAAGTYEFVCAIPGHTQAGMNGRLVVR